LEAVRGLSASAVIALGLEPDVIRYDKTLLSPAEPLSRSVLSDSPKYCEQQHCATRRDCDCRNIEALNEVEAEHAGGKEPTNRCANDANDEIHQQAMVAAGNPLREPTRDNADDDASDDVHETLDL